MKGAFAKLAGLFNVYLIYNIKSKLVRTFQLCLSEITEKKLRESVTGVEVAQGLAGIEVTFPITALLSAVPCIGTWNGA